MTANPQAPRERPSRRCWHAHPPIPSGNVARSPAYSWSQTTTAVSRVRTPAPVAAPEVFLSERIVAHVVGHAGGHEGHPLVAESFPGLYGCVAPEPGQRAGLEIMNVIHGGGAGREDGQPLRAGTSRTQPGLPYRFPDVVVGGSSVVPRRSRRAAEQGREPDLVGRVGMHFEQRRQCLPSIGQLRAGIGIVRPRAPASLRRAWPPSCARWRACSSASRWRSRRGSCPFRPRSSRSRWRCTGATWWAGGVIAVLDALALSRTNATRRPASHDGSAAASRRP